MNQSDKFLPSIPSITQFVKHSWNSEQDSDALLPFKSNTYSYEH